MAYIKNDWETGDVITAEKLNNMEDGISQVDFDQAEMDARLSDEIAALDAKAHEVPTLTFYNTDPNAPMQGT